jgi:hypothetical protein
MPICPLSKIWVWLHSPIKVANKPHSAECLRKEQDHIK